jgi:hypothetical protein
MQRPQTQRIPQQMTRLSLAVHEAAHAVLAERYGLAPSRVTIVTETIASAVSDTPRAVAGHASCGGDLNEITTQTEAERHIKIAMSGTLAERQILPDAEPGAWGGDWAIATKLAGRFWQDGASAVLVLFAKEAARDVQNARDDIMLVAGALLERGTLSGEELRRIAEVRIRAHPLVD